MIIKELVLVEFEKFHNKKIFLKDGINIIYDRDETSKTTVHKFIEGMFLGTVKSSRSLNKRNYYGVLKYQHLKDTYRVERSFSKEERRLKVFNDQTGEKLKNVFEDKRDSRIKNRDYDHFNLRGADVSNKISIEFLEGEKENSYTSLIKTNQCMIDLKTLNKELKQLLEKKDKLVLDIELKEKHERYEKYLEIKTLEEEIKNLEDKIEIDLNSEQISSRQYNDILKINEKIKLSKQQVQSLIKKQENIEEQLSEKHKEFKRLKGLNLDEEVNFDIYNYESKSVQLAKLRQNKDHYNKDAQKEKQSQISVKIKKCKNLRSILIYLIFVISVLGLLNHQLFFISGMLTFVLILTYIRLRKLKKNITILEQLIEKIVSSEYDLKSDIDKVDQEICDILDKYRVKDLNQLKEKSKTFEKQKRLAYEIDSYEDQKNDMDKERAKLTRYYQDMKLDLSYLLEQNNLKDVEELYETIEKREKDKEILPLLESKKHIIKDLKTKNDIEKLSKEFKSFKFEESYLRNIKKENTNLEEYRLLCEEISKKEFIIREIENRIEVLKTNTRNLMTIQDEIYRVKNKGRVNLIDREGKTFKRYKNTKTLKELNIKVVNKKEKFIKLSCMSGQVEDLIRQDNKLPFLLDENFNDYDEARLGNILKAIYRESLKRQIIIFTCEKQEIEMLKKLKLTYSLVEL